MDNVQLPAPPLSPSLSTDRPRRPTRPPPATPNPDLPVDDELMVARSYALDDSKSPMNGHFTHSPLSEEPPTFEQAEEVAKLTPLRAHYLKKTLIALQIGHEIDGLTTASQYPNVSTLSYLGAPFTPPPRNAPYLDVPFFKYIFRKFVISFPFLAAAPKDFFPDKVQPFINSLLVRNLSPTSPFESDTADGDQAARLKMISKIEKNFAFLLSNVTKLAEPEQVVRLTQADLNRLEVLARKRQARQQKARQVFEVNVVCIRVVLEKGRVRSKMHDEFIIRTKRTGFDDVFVSRRYGDFKTLSEELRKRYPDEEVRSPPSKDKTVTTTTTSSSAPFTPRSSTSNGGNDSQESFAAVDRSPTIAGFRLSREKNRLTLRAYLNSLLASPIIASSPVLKHFLLADPTKLSSEEVDDARRREEADKKRDEGRIHFAREIASRIEALRSAVRTVKVDLMQKDGLSAVFDTVRRTEEVRHLPSEYRAVMEWGRITFASTIFQQYIASDDASEKFASLKRLHGLMPYFMLKGVLKISNPVAMIRAALELFTARPFGGQSLLQKMFTTSMQEEVKVLKEDILMVLDKVEDPVICEKLRQFVYAPTEIQDIYRADAASEGISLMTAVLRSGDDPALSRPQMHRILRAHQAYKTYTDRRAELNDSDDEGLDNEDAWLFEDLNLLAKLYARLREREQLIELIFEGNTADLLKDIITIFYSPLAQVYKAASIADSLGDLQNFINDLIRTVEQSEEYGQDDPHRVVQTFIDLVQRHEQAFYHFVHKVHSKGEGLFDSMMKWIESFLTSAREGLGEKISLEYIVPHTGSERDALLKEVDEVARYHYKLKLAHEDKVRRRFGRAKEEETEADAEDAATQRMVDNIMRDLSVGEIVQGDAQEIIAEEDEDGSSEYETASSSGEGSSDEEEDSSTDEGEKRPRSPMSMQPSRSSTISHPPKSPAKPQRFPSQSHSNHQRQVSQGGSGSSSNDGKQLRSRSRTRSLSALKSVLTTKISPPPVPSLPKHPNPHPKPLPSTSRSSMENNASSSQKKLPALPQLRPRKPKEKAAAIRPPELHHIPNLLPIFVEIMRPLLRPTRTHTDPTNA